MLSLLLSATHRKQVEVKHSYSHKWEKAESLYWRIELLLGGPINIIVLFSVWLLYHHINIQVQGADMYTNPLLNPVLGGFGGLKPTPPRPTAKTLNSPRQKAKGEEFL